MLRPFLTLRGCTLAASDGEIGKVREFYFDDELWTVRYLVIKTGAWLAGREVLIAPCALREVDAQSGLIAVALSQQQVRKSPLIETDKPISLQDEERLHRHYDWDPHWVVPGAVPGMVFVPPALTPSPLSENHQPVAPPDPPQRKGDRRLRSSAKILSGYTMHAQDGEIGLVKDFVVDDIQWCVRYLVIHLGLMFLGKDALLAPEWIERISVDGAEVFVNLPRSTIKDAPEYNSALPLGRAYEQRLHDHYSRRGYWDAVKEARNSSS
jgi:hypothetical protein